ncbi:hypothetical protein BH11MYX3_BH11MYX3_06500 [soil metagenome]
MSGKRPRVAKREAERAMKKLVQDREKLALLSPGGSRERPIEVTSSAVIEVRVESLPCPQCEGPYRVREHEAPAPGLRRVDVTCRNCSAQRSLWFRIVSDEPN